MAAPGPAITVTNRPDETAVRNPTWDSPPYTPYVNVLALSASTAASSTVPTGYDACIIYVDGGTLYARIGGTAAIPSATVTDGTASEQIITGSVRRVYEGVAISFINATASKVTLAYHKRAGVY